MKLMPLIFLLMYSVAIGGTIDPNVPDQKYIDYGEKHKCVIKLEGLQNDNKVFYASAVVVHPNIVITAAHLAEDIQYAKALHNEQKHDILFFVVPQEYDKDKFGGNGCDIAIGILKTEIIIDFYPDLYEQDDELNKICSLSGFGITGNFIQGAKISDGKKRAGSNIIEKIEDDLLICSVQNKPNTTLEFLIANGDSGGGLFIDKKLAGIHCSIYTHGTKLNSDKSNFSTHTRISKHKSWIKKIVEEIITNESNISRITGNNGE